MFGIFKIKTFESEMADFDKMAKNSGQRFPIDKLMQMHPMQEMQALMMLTQEASRINALRIDCCRRYNKQKELIHWMNVNERIK